MNAFLKSKSSYRNIISFRKAECIYDITYYFINANLVKIAHAIRCYRQPAQGNRTL